ncbi:MAG: InlB B-repeat-containing protein, partial [Clostridia bacterium]|nr:InlB B-repeat-containing protein [Clostridia bacterium]
MKKTIFRLLLSLLLISVLVGALAACGDPAEFTVTVKDGDTTLKTYTVASGTAPAIHAADLAKTGYSLLGLYTDADMTAEFAPTNGTYPTVTADLTLYAKYGAKEYSVFIDYNNDGSDDLETTFTYGAPYTLETPPERIGYRFISYVYRGADFPMSGTF